MDDNYELVPYKDILELKQELEDLKINGNPEMVNSMKQLTTLLGEFTAVLKEASRGMSEESEGSLKDIASKLDTIIEQNEKIADALVAVGDMLETKPKQDIPTFEQMPQFQPQASFQPPPQLPPIPPPQDPARSLPDIDHFNFGNTPGFEQGIPEFPQDKKRKGLFGRFKK